MSTTVKLGQTDASTGMGIREEVITIPWYQEGLGEQEPILLSFRCLIRPRYFISKGHSLFYIDGVDFVGEDPFSIERVRFHKKGLVSEIRIALSNIYDVELDRIGRIDGRVMWYHDTINA